MSADRILSPSEVRAADGATLAFVATEHLQAIGAATRQIQAVALQAAQAAAARALENHEALGSNAFDDPLTRLATDVLANIMQINTRIEEALREIRPWCDSVQAGEELATRDRGNHPTH